MKTQQNFQSGNFLILTFFPLNRFLINHLDYHFTKHTSFLSFKWDCNSFCLFLNPNEPGSPGGSVSCCLLILAQNQPITCCFKHPQCRNKWMISIRVRTDLMFTEKLNILFVCVCVYFLKHLYSYSLLFFYYYLTLFFSRLDWEQMWKKMYNFGKSYSLP